MVQVAAQRGIGAAVPDAFVGIDAVERGVLVTTEASFVEDEELELRADVDGVTDAGVLDVLLGLLGDVARVAAVARTGKRVLDVGNHGERRATG